MTRGTVPVICILRFAVEEESNLLGIVFFEHKNATRGWKSSFKTDHKMKIKLFEIYFIITIILSSYHHNLSFSKQAHLQLLIRKGMIAYGVS